MRGPRVEDALAKGSRYYCYYCYYCYYEYYYYYHHHRHLRHDHRHRHHHRRRYDFGPAIYRLPSIPRATPWPFIPFKTLRV